MIEFDYGRDLTERSAGPDLTPMIDVIFQLLIFFLLTSFLIIPAINVALPRSRSTAPGCVPGGTVSSTRPSSVGPSIRAPSTASGTEIASVRQRAGPSRSNRGSGAMRTTP